MQRPRRQNDTSCPACPTPDVAWAWIDILTEMALDGDEDAGRVLPDAIQHAIEVEASS